MRRALARLGSARRRSAVVLLALAGAAAALAGYVSGSTGAGTTPSAPPSTPSASPTTATQLLPGTGRPVVSLGDKNTPEEFILGELYDQALTAQGFSVTLTRNIGPTSVSVQALSQGSLSIYPEYLSTWNRSVAGYHRSFRTLAGAFGAGQLYAATHSMQLLAATPFSDTQGIAVTTAFARAHHLRSIEDLRRVAAGLTLGTPIEFAQDPGGLPAIEDAYGFQPATTKPIEIGQQYDDLRSGLIQAAYVDTTDGDLQTPEFTVLRDPRHILGYGNVIPVATDAVIAAEGPAFVATVNRVSRLLSTQVMRELNAQFELANQAPASIARQFLLAQGLVVASGPA